MSNLARGTLLAIFLVVATYFAGGVYGVFDFLLNAQNEAALPLDFGFGGSRITGIPRVAWDAGIRRNDVLLEINGRPFTGYTVMREEVGKFRPGERIPIVIRKASDASIVKLQLLLTPRLPEPAPLWSWIWKLVTQILFPILCVTVGFWVVIMRHRDPSAWLLLFIMFSSLTVIPDGSWRGYWAAFAVTFGFVLAKLVPGGMLLFAIYFPDRSEFDRKSPWLKWIILLPLTGGLVIPALWSFWKQVDINRIDSIAPWLSSSFLFQQIVGMAAISCFFAILGQKGGVATLDAKRRLNILWMGSAVSLTPSFLVTIYSLATGQDWGNGIPQWILFLVVIGLAVFPLTMAYVVVAHRAMAVRGVLRQSMKYSLARGGLTVLRGIIGSAAIAQIVDASHKSNQAQQYAGFALGGIGLIALRSKYSGHASDWMDRQFFREAYSSEQILSDLSSEVRKYSANKPLIETVTSRISGTLHTPRVSVLVAHDDGFSGDGVVLGANSSVTQKLVQSGKPAEVYFDDPDSWVRQLDAADQQTLQSLEARLLLPLAGRERMVGLMALGPKLSEEPYSGADIQLLQTVATQTGLAIENNDLVAKLAAEAAGKARMNRELEIAQEVQQRLFPQRFPDAGGLDCSGKCRPALSVGGDYFDFLTLPGGKLGIAIGDISGKGISAALLMASLRSGLRGQTIGGGYELSALMANMNQLVYEASASNRYATFFYGEFDPASRHLEFVNAGHNAPVILRGPEELRLEAGGPVVGLLPQAGYEQMSVDLLPGDIFIGYTDGVSEAMNPNEDEWGDDNMIASARAHRALKAHELIDAILADADAFAAGAEQHDDMTLLVIKL